MDRLSTKEFWFGSLLTIAGLWLAISGAMWIWAGLSTVVGDMSSACETIALRFFGPGTTSADRCFAQEDRSPLGIPGALSGLLMILVGIAILVATFWVVSKAIDFFTDARRTTTA